MRLYHGCRVGGGFNGCFRFPLLLAIPELRLVDIFPTPIGNVRQIYLFELRNPS
jgi:hypothetical protein